MSPDIQQRIVMNLYDAAARGVGLQAALTDMAHGFGATVAHLVASDPTSQAPRWATATDVFGGELLGASQRYDADLFRIDPRRVPGMARLARDGAWLCQDLIGEREVARSAFYQDFYLPLGLRHSMVVRLPTAGTEWVDLALVRGPDHRAFDATGLQALRALAPHLRTALALQQQAAALHAGRAAHEAAAMDALVLDEHRGLTAITPGAAAQVGSVFGRLVFGAGAQRRGQPQVDAALVATRRDGLPRHVGLGPAQGLQERLWLTISRRQSAEGRWELLLILRWPDRRHALQPEVLQQMLGLTRREAEVGCALLDGRSPREIWTERGLSPATVRSQLSSLYAKTGTRGQVEFVRLVAQLTQGPLPGGSAGGPG